MIPNPAFFNLSTQVQEAFKRNNAPGMVVPNAPLGNPVPKTNPFKWLEAGYTSPQIGTPGYTTTFNALGTTGLGKNNANPLDINKWGAGLWAAGFDPNDPNLGYRLWEFNQARQGKDPDYQKRISEQVSKHGWDLNTQSGLAEAIDWYYRDLSRRMDKSNSFFDSTLGKIVGAVAPIAGGFFGGPLVGAAIGATTGGLSGGPLGAVLGGLGGYGSGSLGKTLATGGLSGAIKAATGGLFGGGSTGATAAGGGSGMSFFSTLGDILKGSAGDIIGGALNYFGGQNAQDNLMKAARAASAGARFNPYNVSGPGGGGYFSGNTATGALSPALQAQLDRFGNISSQAYGAYQVFNPNNFAQNMYKTIKEYKAPEDTFQANQFLDRLYASGQWGSTPGERSLFNFARGKQAEDNLLRFQAQEAGAQEQNRLFDLYTKSVASQAQLADIPMEYLRLGANVGGAQASAGATAAQFPWLAANSSAAASTNFWSFLGNTFGTLAQNTVNAFSPKEPARSVYGGVPNPTGAVWR